MKVAFTGIMPQYTLNKRVVFPIFEDMSQQQIDKAISVTQDPDNKLAEGTRGVAYVMGQDLVVKKYKPSAAIVHDNNWSEAEKLDILYEFLQENPKLGNSQKGITAFQDENGEVYLVTSRVNGAHADPVKNPLTERNLHALVNIIKELDKGSNKLGRMMVYDLGLGNTKFTDCEAGVLDFEFLSPLNIDDDIRNNVLGENLDANCHAGDTSYLPSNLRSFEFAQLRGYLSKLPREEASSLFEDYLEAKSDYHKDMSVHYAANSSRSEYPGFFNKISRSEAAHSELLKRQNGKVPQDIKEAEIRKIQMSEFVFTSSRFCDSYSDFNIGQITEFHKNSLDFFNEKLDEAIIKNDENRIIYFNNCIDLFAKWEKFSKDPEKMEDSQIKRLSEKHLSTFFDIK